MSATTPARRAARSLLLVPALALALTACGGAAERPTVEELADGFQQIIEEAEMGEAGELFTPEAITCIAEKLEASDLDDETLATLAEGRDEQRDQETADQVEEITGTATMECVSA
ncbi:hypothetical protein [Serinibacter arcticus]|uniref:Lipoprotein n=1 Tax=Serinibacter arcticus TaxID=1655435 RepID=A0A4Z1EB25_9MICO|nr:hypothetical protein [Serinibacter arcticus]TGO06631.1 hypothetical protein SERN_0823 [Serinibacter arcticus]